MIYTPSDLADMTTEQRRETLDQQAQAFYGNDRWKASLSRDTGISHDAVKNWYNGRSEPPIWPVLMLQAWLEIREQASILDRVKHATGFLHDFSA